MPPTRRRETGNVLVVGAGVVGVCCALYLQREGFPVTLIDRQGPGEGCSSGNAGQLGIDACVPFAVPGIVRRLPRLLLDPREPLTVRWRYLPKALPYLLRHLAASNARRVGEIARARASLLERVFDAYAPLLHAAGADPLVRRVGRLVVYESRESFARSRFAMDLRRRNGVKMEEINGERCRQMEPALGPSVACGVFFPEAGHTVNPLRLTRALAAHFAQSGGIVLREMVKGLEVGSDGPLRLVGNSANHTADTIVIAAGFGSRRLARQLGSTVSMEAERGYHVMLPDPRVDLRVPLTLGDRGVAVATMEHGLRASGVAEFAGSDAPPDYTLADRVLRHAMDVIPGLNAEGATRWMGNRPSTPDFLPVIGRSPRHEKVYFAFGHGHTGLTLAAVTGELIGQLVAGRPTSVDLTPFRPNRF